jgi:ribonuclease BN (tRNA processing enzyme)
MKLEVLGSGTSVPHAQRCSPAFWLETVNGSVLLDVSADAPHQMARQGLDWPNVDSIWVSHFHLDHMAGLFPLLFSLKHAPQTQMRRKVLRIFGGQGMRERVTALDSAGNYGLFEQNFVIDFEEIEPGGNFEIVPDVQATTFATPHTKESMALRLLEQGAKSFVYTSDTGFSDDLVNFAAGVDLLLLECSFRRDKPVQTHLELSEAMRLATACAPRKLVLTHLYPEWDQVDLVAEAKRFYAGETVEATDGLILEI